MSSDHAQDSTRPEHLAQLGTLFAGFAHEIRNPLSTIGLNLQLVKEDFAAAESSRDRRTFKRLAVVEGEVKRLQAILEELLRFVRSSAPRRRSVDLDQLLQRLVEFHQPEMRGAGIALKFIRGTAVGRVDLDPDQISAVLVNLLRNAREACPAGAEILVSSGRSNGEVRIQVTDTGAGMPSEVAARVFQPYFSTKKTGTGLGLAVAKRIVEAHGGRLELHSEVGRGTQLTVRLPLVAAAPEHAPSAEQSDP